MRKFEGSCACGSVHYTAETDTPAPYLKCYCSICRKSAGSGGYAVFIRTLGSKFNITSGHASIGHYRAAKDSSLPKDKQELFPLSRSYCTECGTYLFFRHFENREEGEVYLFASSIDNVKDVPVAPVSYHIFLAGAPEWAKPDKLRKKTAEVATSASAATKDAKKKTEQQHQHQEEDEENATDLYFNSYPHIDVYTYHRVHNLLDE
ncbi:hypothetical protein GQ42DRAFT_65318 [Ramicandelaber brevisporus]|nr:hypothetical protein GQ42DRAFT_65318 [Ramicandelaber brevisporus]